MNSDNKTGVGFTFNKSAKDNLDDGKMKNVWQKHEQEKMMNMQKEHDNLKRDETYVKTLTNWEKNFLPKIK